MGKNYQNGDGEVRIVCFTGHRRITHEATERLPELLEETIAELCSRGATVFRAGGAMGFDTLAALIVLEMKKEFPQIRLELVLPCRDQTKDWDEISRRTYHYIMQKADCCRFLFDSYFEGCMLERDRQLVDGSDVCVAYCAHSQGGTAYTYTLAMRDGLEIINLHDLI